MDKETKEEITKGKEKDMLKARFNKIDDDITSAQLRVEIEKRDEMIDQLRTEVHRLKEELTQVKERNKKLYQILSHGESECFLNISNQYTFLIHETYKFVICPYF